jgi:K+-transporting ATPase ATPase C chain
MVFIMLSLLTGVFYPMAVTVLARAIFPRQAAGSMIQNSDGSPIGSLLIGQSFTGPKYFWPRPSATADFPYNALASGGSNLGPTNKDLLDRIAGRAKLLRESGVKGPLPADIVSASGSGLDPHISIAGAAIQVPRIARERRMPEEKINMIVSNHIEGRQFGFFGVQRVNVLKLNLALDSD